MWSKLLRDKLITVFLEKNSQINLSAIRDEDWVQKKHINDSIELLKLDLIKPSMFVLDVGTWGWFPLLPLAMSLPDTNFVGLDWRKKKIDAINDMVNQLGIKNAKWSWSRIEDYRWQFDILTARAVAYTDKLIPWSYHLVKKWWLFVLYKQRKPEERADLHSIARKKKLLIQEEHRYTLFEGDIERVIYVLKKT